MTQNRTLDLSPTRFRNSSTTQSRVDSARNASLPAATQAMERVMVSIHRRDEVFAHFQRSFVRNGGLRYRLLCFFLIVNALSILGRDAIAAEQKANPITGYQLVIMPPNTVFTSKFFLGWIRLVNGQEDAGHIYLDDAPPQDPAHTSSLLCQQLLFPCCSTFSGMKNRYKYVFTIRKAEILQSSPLSLPKG
jgi:hypothetical protein